MTMPGSDHAHAGGAQRTRVITRLSSFAPLAEAEVARLAAMSGSPRLLKRGAHIRGADETPTHLNLLIEGWAASAITLADGCRQLTMVSLPGDMLGLPSLAMREPIDAVVALTPAVVLDIPVEALSQLFVDSPRLAMLIFLISQEERVFAMERLALLGQAKARVRLAALFLRLSERIAQFEQMVPDQIPMPLTQQELGDLIGVSAVHVNAMIKQLREAGVVSMAARTLSIHDRAALAKEAGVSRWRRSDPSWLPPAAQPG